MKPRQHKALKLRARSPADYDVVAACLQDALMPLSEMTFLPAERRFVAVFDRFIRERSGPPLYIVQAALRVEGVDAARLRNIDQAAGAVLLELLTIVPDDGALELMFAGGGMVRLEGGAMLCLVEDLAEPRPALVAPMHGATPGRGEPS